jgi:hypothetical protein
MPFFSEMHAPQVTYFTSNTNRISILVSAIESAFTMSGRLCVVLSLAVIDLV